MLRHVVAASFSLVLLVTTPAFAQVNWLNFSPWDHSTVSGAGQLFVDIFEDADANVTVTSPDGFGAPTTAGPAGIFSPRPQAGTNIFNFVFSRSLPLVVEVQTTDLSEEVVITSSTSKTYSHAFGAMPTLTTQGNSLVINGTSYLVTPNGASRGLIYINPTDQLSVSHEGLAEQKYERFRVGVLTAPIPEPGSASLLVLSLFGLVGIYRRRYSR